LLPIRHKSLFCTLGFKERKELMMLQRIKEVVACKLLPVLTAKVFPETYKEIHELAFWKWRKGIEGALWNRHYEHFYTEHFGLSPNFYSGKRILDIGCGPCGSLEWADMAAERIGLDPLADDYRKLGASNHKMRYVSAHSESIPFPDGYFDVVCSFNSLDHVSSLERTIAEVIRVVKPGGLFLLLSEVNHDPTACEPIEFSWDIVESFKPYFEVLADAHFERKTEGLYDSIHEAIPYDHGNATRRYGVLSAKLQRLPVKSS
jgi:ubiquinone/menaquinone biosynthesis C-methylase UbiE